MAAAGRGVGAINRRSGVSYGDEQGGNGSGEFITIRNGAPMRKAFALTTNIFVVWLDRV